MMSNKKYELVNYNETTRLHQVKYLRDIPRCNVKIGDLGGWVSSENNLSHYDDCVVSDNARVFGNAHVFGNTEVTRNALNINCPELYGYNITFTDYHIQIGCMQMLYPEWLLVDEEDAEAMGLERKYYKNVKELLETTIKQYYGDKV